MKILLLTALLSIAATAHAKTPDSPKWEIVVTEAEDKDHPKTIPYSGNDQAIAVGAKGWTCKANKSSSDPLEFGVLCTHTSEAIVALASGCNAKTAYPGELGLANIGSKLGTSISIRCDSAKPSAKAKK
ncbi:MAG: hypothetical protein ACXVBE_07980 [Bdellovibrionota bacterium]